MGSTAIAGFASGIIVTLGIMIGLMAGTQAYEAIIAGITAVAIVEAFSDAFGEYLSQKTEKTSTIKIVWKDAISIFGAKFIVVFQFIFPYVFLPIVEATKFSIFWGLFTLSIVSGYIAKKQEKKRIIRTMAFYDLVAVIIMAITYSVGDLVSFILSLLGFL